MTGSRSLLAPLVRCFLHGLAGRLGPAFALTLAAGAQAQTSAAPFTQAVRYDVERRVTGTIAPDPDGAGPLPHAAVRNSYDPAGRLVRIETGELATWQSEAVDPASWPGFAIQETRVFTYDAMGRRLLEVMSAGGTVFAVTQTSYDSMGRVSCTAVRMNPTRYPAADASGGQLPASACTQGPAGDHGPDRITRNVYHQNGQVLKVQRGVGTLIEQDYATYGYSPNGKRTSLTDANGNPAQMRYDGFDRQDCWIFPSKSPAGQIGGDCALGTGDFEKYSYDESGNRTRLRKRDGTEIVFAYDALNRMTEKHVPASASGAPGYSVFYGYDLRGLQIHARFGSASGPGVTSDYDGLGRLVSSSSDMDGSARTLSYGYDAHGNKISASGGWGYVTRWAWDSADRPLSVGEGSNTVVRLAYDPQGRRQSLDGGVDAPTQWTSYGYDPLGRLRSLGRDLAGTGSDQTLTFGYNPASQIVERTSSNDDYASNTAYAVNRSYAVNGLNQYTGTTSNGSPSASFAYDANGNLTNDGSTAFVYDAENRLVSASGAKTAQLSYDPLGRLWQVTGPAGTTRFLYDGDDLIWENDAAGAMLRAYAHGPGADEPLVWYEAGAGRRLLHADHQGSIVAIADELGNKLAINAYDAWGIPNEANQGRFGYTGQAWLPELGMWHYKARIYSPTLGRFLQTDPIGYEDQVNLYAYVGNDPVNHVDPDGQESGSVAYASIRSLNEAARENPPPPAALEASKYVPWVGLMIRGAELIASILGSKPVAPENAAQGSRASTLRPGPYAKGSIPAHRGRPSTAERRALNKIGDRDGCHTCGARDHGNKGGGWTPDHQPPTALTPPGQPQRYYPHCSQCRLRQGGEVRQATRRNPPPRRPRPDE